MARPLKTGIDYFPLDAGFFDDDKILLIESEFGIKGGYIAIRLLCKIYKEGYYYKWGADECLLFTKSIGVEGVSGNMVNEVVKGLVRRKFFDKGCFDRFGILTSKGIQQRYIEATRRYKKINLISEYLLIDSNNAINADINPVNGCTNPQKKRNQKKPETDNRFPFDEFWDLYDKKVGDKSKLRKKWNRIPEKEKQLIFSYIPMYKQAQPDKRYRKNPETFLNCRGWNDEIIYSPNVRDNEYTKQPTVVD